MRPLLRRVPPPPPVQAELPPLALVDEAGRALGPAALRGQVHVAAFFSTDCTTCCPALLRSLADLADRYEAAGAAGIRVVGIAVDPGPGAHERAVSFAARHGIQAGRIALLAGDAAPPLPGAHEGRLFLVDPRGGIRGVYGHDALGLDEVYHRSLHVRDERR
jgi:cytochrome oxidase Cu insertion factor (SCO1/SenC/PrrC family)